MAGDPESAEVKASGCVTYRRTTDAGVEVVLVHRPKYDDWSLPKGKLDPGESWATAALRELHEETGQRGALGHELEPVFYDDRKGRAKAVRYWIVEADPDRSEPFKASDEVDEIRWLPPEQATQHLTHQLDRGVLAQAIETLGDDGR
jgi:8-oxo-dGTP diphosphatase